MKHHKLGFSLIEILVFFSIIITFSICAFLIYKTVNNNSKIKMISDDFKYVASKISHDMSGLKQDNLSVKSGCCETFSFIDSGLPFVSGTPAFEPNYIHAEAEKNIKIL